MSDTNKFLNKNGLTHLWAKIKTELDNKLVSSDLNNYVQQEDLNDYAKQGDLKDYAKQGDLKDYATVEDLNGYVTTDTLTNNYMTGEQTESLIENYVGKVYRIRGSWAAKDTTGEEIPELANASVGDVWNIAYSFTTTEDFVEGAGYTYPAGTNIVASWVTNASYPEGVKKWDVLSGLVDVAVEVEPITNDEIDAILNQTE